MGLRRAMAVLTDHWDEVRGRLTVAEASDLDDLVGDFVDEGDPESSADIAERVMDLLRERLPVQHSVRRALVESEHRFQGPARRAVEFDAWFRMVESLRVRLGAPAMTSDIVMREGSDRLLAAAAFSEDEVRARGQDPDERDLIRLHRRDGTAQWPAFQFGPDGAPWAVVRTINRLLEAADDPFGVADWWLGENGWLGDSPARLIGRVPDDLLIAVARTDEAEV